MLKALGKVFLHRKKRVGSTVPRHDRLCLCATGGRAETNYLVQRVSAGHLGKVGIQCKPGFLGKPTHVKRGIPRLRRCIFRFVFQRAHSARADIREPVKRRNLLNLHALRPHPCDDKLVAKGIRQRIREHARQGAERASWQLEITRVVYPRRKRHCERSNLYPAGNEIAIILENRISIGAHCKRPNAIAPKRNLNCPCRREHHQPPLLARCRVFATPERIFLRAST